MPIPPRWLRFRLSTILILTAIAAWVMALRPWIQVGFGDVNRLQSFGWRDGSADSAFQIAILGIRTLGPNSTTSGAVAEFGPNPELLWPALALFAFVTWKAGWAIAAWRRAPPPREKTFAAQANDFP
jgi:uncharacterized membrane protein